jgi:O-antigen ligase
MPQFREIGNTLAADREARLRADRSLIGMARTGSPPNMVESILGKDRSTLIEAGQRTAAREVRSQKPAALSGAFFWLSAFYFIYCARPEDWIKVLGYIPLAKITGVFALIGLLSSLGRTQRKLRDIPRESWYLLAMIGLLFASALLSPIWKGGALNHTLDFAKVYVAWTLTFLVVTDFTRLRRIIYIQSASVVLICVVSIIIGHSRSRLEGVIGGIYSNPNDLAFSIVLTLPFCLAFLLTAKSSIAKVAWAAGMLVMALALFLTASRGGFITLLVAGAICLWHFGIKGRRLYLLAISGFVVVLLLVVAGGPLMNRMGTFAGEDTRQQTQASESYEQRKFLVRRAIDGIEHYPVLGLGVRNFQQYSGVWRDVHVTYLQIAVEGGIPALVLYLLFFFRGFSNLRKLLRMRDLDVQTTLFVQALHSSMVGFVVGALFSPEAYQLFPYFSVAYSAVLVAIVSEREHCRTLWSLGRPAAGGGRIFLPRAGNRMPSRLSGNVRVITPSAE